jgi:hypothetical protein
MEELLGGARGCWSRVCAAGEVVEDVGGDGGDGGWSVVTIGREGR